MAAKDVNTKALVRAIRRHAARFEKADQVYLVAKRDALDGLYSAGDVN